MEQEKSEMEKKGEEKMKRNMKVKGRCEGGGRWMEKVE